MKLQQLEELIKPINSAVVLLSGGLDSTIALALLTKYKGADNIKALSFYYGQKQEYELKCAAMITKKLGVEHQKVNLKFLSDFSMGFSSNVDPSMDTPTIKEILGDPQPSTYIPHRNLLLLSIAAAYAETKNVESIVCGIQEQDEYSYWDANSEFVNNLNNVLSGNRKNAINIVAPFSSLNKADEILLLKECYGNIDLLADTLTCYDPHQDASTLELSKPCGVCPACAERSRAFEKVGLTDPVTLIGSERI